jgi:FrmR/RcnR family transcriptional regulator, repressor of frmRAB operon
MLIGQAAGIQSAAANGSNSVQDRILPHSIGKPPMTHPTQGKEKRKLLIRLKRIRGQIDAVERRIQEDATCAAILQQATACRGALDGFIAEVIEDHILERVIDPSIPRDDPRTQAAEELVEIVHSYLT